MNDAARSDAEDLEICAREGRRPRDDGPYRVQVGDALFRFQAITADAAVQTGRSVLELTGLEPADDYVLFAVLTDGLLEEIRMEEAIDLRNRVEKFLAFRNDRMFRFLLDGRDYQWGGCFISGASLLKLAKLDGDSHSVWLQGADGEPSPIGRSQLIDLAAPGVEHFVTRPLDQA